MSSSSPLEEIFFAAIEKRSADERAAYLDEACGDDKELRARVERMLTAQANAGSCYGNAESSLRPSSLRRRRGKRCKLRRWCMRRMCAWWMVRKPSAGTVEGISSELPRRPCDGYWSNRLVTSSA